MKLEVMPPDLVLRCRQQPDGACSAWEHRLLRQILGRVAWTKVTRPEAAVAAAILQSKAHSPTRGNLLEVYRLAVWLRNHPSDTFYPRMEGPFRLVVVSDAAYKWEEPEKPYARRWGFYCSCSSSSNCRSDISLHHHRL